MNISNPAQATTQTQNQSKSTNERLTPMMEQYIEIKAANPDYLLFYRMGDFYELFFDDAEIASQALGITLTKRGKHLGADIPMCGVPVHTADEYLQKLIVLEHKVAICEQMEDPAEAKKRGAKAVVKRDVVRLVTPGTLTEEHILNTGHNNYLASLVHNPPDQPPFALSWADMSTGAFFVRTIPFAQISSLLARIEPKELILTDALLDQDEIKSLLQNIHTTISPVPKNYFDGVTAEERLCQYFSLKTLKGYGEYRRVELSAAAAIVSYIETTQLSAKPPLCVPKRESAINYMTIDSATRTNLEIMKTLNGSRKGSLYAAINRTITGAGARLLATWLAAPSTNSQDILHRQDAISWALSQTTFVSDTRSVLKSLPDIARALTRLIVGRGGPRDMAAIRDGLIRTQTISSDIKKTLQQDNFTSSFIKEIQQSLDRVNQKALFDLYQELQYALKDELPLLVRDGGFIRGNYNALLDEKRQLRDESRKIIALLQSQYAMDTNIKNLKIKHNNILGYFVEVTAQNASVLQNDPDQRFIHRQTMANAMRFATTKLAELEQKISTAAEEALKLEHTIFDELLTKINQQTRSIQTIADTLAMLDVIFALSVLAEQENYCRPVVDDSLTFNIEGGRHPVVEQVLAKTSQPFVTNDCHLSAKDSKDAGQIWLLTGPNMAGKSTFLRQNALIAILAQIGSYVPAKTAQIGIVDALFSRVGASDDLARGHSTFMVEMLETAAILNQAGPRSLIILDEIGRGTATYDGLAIAWATVEHLHEVNQSRALFATHYHELTALAQKLDRLSNATVKVKEWQGSVIFLHEIIPGAATSSYGIQVAKLAGLPEAVLARAKGVLEQLEKSDLECSSQTLIDDLPLFSTLITTEHAEQIQTHPVLKELDKLDPDDMTPRAALDALYDLKKMLERQR